MDSKFSVKSKVAIVTGAGRGLGKAMASELAASGAYVAIVDVDLDAAKEAAQSIRETGGQAVGLAADVSDADSVDKMVDAVLKEYGTVDILVNNAGIQRRNPCIEMSEEDWDAVISVNLKGTWLCSRAVGKVMVKNKSGKVINIASLLGSVAQPGRGPYAASKGAVVQLTKVLALEWAPYNINVNAIGPGYVMTELNTALMEDKAAFDELTSRIPMGRWCEPEEIANAAIFLASDAASYITGQVIFVEGGYLCL